MVGTLPTISTVPLPRRPPDPLRPGVRPEVRARHWYENDLGWETVPGAPLRLVTGVRFDVLDVPAEAGAAGLRRLTAGSPVALQGDRMRLLVAAGSAEELPGLLEWLEWGALAPDLLALGEGGHMDAPVPPEPVFAGGRPPRGRAAVPLVGPVQGAAVWLRPPEPGREVEASLPTLSALGGAQDAPDLVRLVETVATHCHRVRLRRPHAQPAVRHQTQPLAFS
ncbi:SCO3374 family protein [Streptomyces sp. NPDC006739]|uniref:SCO3374 family protein n=1 Tax=Streptomyces sp. NPDC006739 TaxID=3364763 RepID=UPI00368C8A86